MIHYVSWLRPVTSRLATRRYQRLNILSPVATALVHFPYFSTFIGSKSLQHQLRASPGEAMGKAKRKSVSTSAQESTFPSVPPQLIAQSGSSQPPAKRRASQRKQSLAPSSVNPDTNADILDGPEALRASPDAEENDEKFNMEKVGMNAGRQIKDENEEVPSLVTGESDSSLSDISDMESPIRSGAATKQAGKGTQRPSKNDDVEAVPRRPATVAKPSKEKTGEQQFLDPEADGEEEADEEEIQAALTRPPPVNSGYLPLPWKGRLGYV